MYLRAVWGGGLGLLPELPEWLRNLKQVKEITKPFQKNSNDSVLAIWATVDNSNHTAALFYMMQVCRKNEINSLLRCL